MFQLSDLFPDPSLFPQTAPGFIQLVIVAAAYGYVLFLGAGLISDGSEVRVWDSGNCIHPVEAYACFSSLKTIEKLT